MAEVIWEKYALDAAEDEMYAQIWIQAFRRTVGYYQHDGHTFFALLPTTAMKVMSIIPITLHDRFTVDGWVPIDPMLILCNLFESEHCIRDEL